MKLSDMLSADTKSKSQKKPVPTKSADSRATKIPAVDVALGGDTSINKKQPFKELDPARCRPWKHHNRHALWLTKERCGSLIESIQKEGQRQMGLVRVIEGDPDFDYEIIYGVRRWYACSQIEGRKYKAEVTKADDHECARLMNLENEESEDITDFEKACAYKDQIDSGIFAEKIELAKELNISQAMVTRLTRAAEIMENKKVAELLNAYVLDISIRGASTLSEMLAVPEKRKLIEAKVVSINKEIAEGKEMVASKILQDLIAVGETKKRNTVDRTYLSYGKKKLVHAKRNEAGKLTITIDQNFRKIQGEKAGEELDKLLLKIASELV